MLQRYVHFVQCIHKTHSHHVKKMQDNIRIVLTLSILKNKNAVTTDWIEIKLMKFIMLIYILIVLRASGLKATSSEALGRATRTATT